MMWPFKKREEPRGWPHSHRMWHGVEIRGVGTVVGWDADVPGRLLCMTPDGTFVNHDLPDYRETEHG